MPARQQSVGVSEPHPRLRVRSGVVAREEGNLAAGCMRPTKCRVARLQCVCRPSRGRLTIHIGLVPVCDPAFMHLPGVVRQLPFSLHIRLAALLCGACAAYTAPTSFTPT